MKFFFNRSKMTLNDFFTFFIDRIANFYFLKNDFDWIYVFSHFWALNEIMNPQMRVIVYVDKKDYFELNTYILLILFFRSIWFRSTCVKTVTKLVYILTSYFHVLKYLLKLNWIFHIVVNHYLWYFLESWINKVSMDVNFIENCFWKMLF